MSMLPGQPGITAPTELSKEIGAAPEELRRLSLDEKHQGVLQRQWGLQARIDPTVTFEEFQFWAKIEREMEVEENKHHIEPAKSGGIFGFLKGTKNTSANDHSTELAGQSEKTGTVMANPVGDLAPIAPSMTHDYDADWRKAARALRTVGWVNIFYLITTDILGWSQTPYVFANTGYALGAGMFVLMGFAAGAAGLMIWWTFIKLDSSRYPMVSFGDAYFRLFGPWVRHFINVLQSIQMFLTVCVILLGQTSILKQLIPQSCFIGLGVFSLVVCMMGGYMRSLKAIGWFANSAVWINIVSFIIIMAAAATHAPDTTIVIAASPGMQAAGFDKNPPPPTTFVGVPPDSYQPTGTGFSAQFNGVNSITYAYSGALLFMAFLAEMRHPMDFWKGVLMAQAFIACVYLLFGLYVYSRYGQYSYSIINQVVSPVSLQIVSNVFGLLTGWIAVWMYFNVGLKTVYVEVGQEVFGLPPIPSKKGKWFWLTLGPLYWILGFIFAMSVPDFNGFTSFVGGLFSFNFTYSFSGLMFTGLMIQEGARLPGEGFDPSTGITTRHDKGLKRWVRGFFKKWYLSIPALLFTCAGFAASGMGTWAATLALIEAFAGGVATSWSCSTTA
ncbi:Hypothetical protein R9X50_00417400 [Acrodontium crateriforme]|uniref:Amino acid transporter transmembrane domain-containing protein n=1 Tax=Acrodontium crateriforme TaxID=150365 RepID=A0AAQ3RCH7_9PEZI|nr:Hypothetical protein R9X50_00417400 [Acrodontium crateriforme]